MTIHAILALTDFSVSAEHAVERAAQIAKMHRATLKLMYFDQSKGHINDPLARLTQRARQLSERRGLPVQPVAHTTDALHDVVREARHADLLVLEQRYRQVLDFRWPSLTPLRLIRHCRCPVLVVKNASRRPYAKLLVAVDFAADWNALVDYARGFETDAALEVRKLVAAMDGDSEERSPIPRRLPTLTSPMDALRERLMADLGLVKPAMQSAARRAVDGGELLVVGTQRRSAVIDFLCGSASERLVKRARCDILVVPERYAQQVRWTESSAPGLPSGRMAGKNAPSIAQLLSSDAASFAAMDTQPSVQKPQAQD